MNTGHFPSFLVSARGICNTPLSFTANEWSPGLVPEAYCNFAFRENMLWFSHFRRNRLKPLYTHSNKLQNIMVRDYTSEMRYTLKASINAALVFAALLFAVGGHNLEVFFCSTNTRVFIRRLVMLLVLDFLTNFSNASTKTFLRFSWIYGLFMVHWWWGGK